MFSSKSKDAPLAPQPAIPVPPLPAKRTRTLSAPSLISADMTINGTINSTGDIQIGGRVEGDVRSNGLVIGDKAEIHGEVYAEDITVRGKVVGRIRARKVLLAATSHVEGDILHEALAVESGAFFEGNCRHSDNPLGAADNSADNSLGSAMQGASRTQAIHPPAAAPDNGAGLFGPLTQPAT